MTKRILYIFLMAFPVLLFTSCKGKKKEEAKMESMPGMNMPAGEMAQSTDAAIELDTNALKGLLRPTSEFVVASLPTVTLQQSTESAELKVLGSVQYDNRQIHTVSSRIAGRIEKLYVRYRYQHVYKGQKVFDVYSPELLTAQENLILIAKTDAANTSLINAARQRLLLLGMSGQQVAQIQLTGKAFYSVSVYSNYSGHAVEPGFHTSKNNNTAGMPGSTDDDMGQGNTGNNLTTAELPVKEGMYVQKAQPVLTLVNVSQGRINLSIFAGQQNLVKKGMAVMIIPETAPAKKFRAFIDRIEPFFQPGTKTLSARVYFNNATMDLPIGSQVQATIFTPPQTAYMLPASAVLTTGLNNVVFRKEGNGFSPKTVSVGFRYNGRVQITAGLSATDTVAVNAQHFIESESIINVKK